MALLLLAVTGCASEPPIEVARDGNPLAARRLLAEQARAGAVPLELRGELPLPESNIIGSAARGIGGMPVQFSMSPPAPNARRLVLGFERDSSGAVLCRRDDQATRTAPTLGRAAATAPAGPVTPQLTAAYCDGAVAIASARGVAGGNSREAVERLVWRTTARLFPDDYPGTYGFGLFDGITFSIGGGVSF